MTGGQPAHLVDVDLHIESRRSLAALHAALPGAQPRDIENPKWLHLAGSTSRRAKTADPKILELVALVDALPRSARKCWNEASVRTFDIGIQAGPAVDRSKGFRPFEGVLSADTLRAVCRLKGRILLTVYPPDEP